MKKSLRQAQRIINEMLYNPSEVYPLKLVRELWDKQRNYYDDYIRCGDNREAGELAADSFIEELSSYCDEQAANDLRTKYRQEIIDFFADDMDYFYDGEGKLLPLLGHQL